MLGRIGVPRGRCVSACVIGEPGGQLSESPLEPMVLAVLDRESGCLPGVPMGQLVRARGSVGTLSFFSRAMSRCRLSRLSGGGILPESPTILVAATIVFRFQNRGGGKSADCYGSLVDLIPRK